MPIFWHKEKHRLSIASLEKESIPNFCGHDRGAQLGHSLLTSLRVAVAGPAAVLAARHAGRSCVLRRTGKDVIKNDFI